MWYETRKVQHCTSWHFITSDGQKIFGHTYLILRGWAKIIFIIHAESFLIFVKSRCTCVFFCYSHKKDQLYILFDCRPCAHLFMDKLHRHRWKARYSFAQKPMSCKLPQLCNFCRQLSGPFCHLSPQQPFREGGNYQSTPLLVSTNHQTHELNEVKTPEKLIFLNWKKCKYFKPITQQRHKKSKLFSGQTFTRT